MARVGLSGKSFIPLLSSFACAIPGIMSARVIENPRDRLLTILVAPLMSCSARFPVYALLINAFIPDIRWSPFLPGLQALVMFAMYLAGIVAAVARGVVLRRTIFKGPTPPFVMELPSYKIPGVGLVVHRMLESGWSFVQRAGTLILAVSIVSLGGRLFPPRYVTDSSRIARSADAVRERAAVGWNGDQWCHLNVATPLDRRARRAVGGRRQHDRRRIAATKLSRANRSCDRTGRSAVGLGLANRLCRDRFVSAREVIVATLGVIYNLGQGQDEKSLALRDTLRQATWEGTSRPVFNIPVALSIMIFFSLCAQCVSDAGGHASRNK